MKAQILEDRIISTGSGIEIGRLPKGAGLERLRWDGEKIIDLLNLSAIWVRQIGSAFELHAVQVYDSQLVQMTYPDRKHLTDDNGVIRLLTEQERIDRQKAEVLAQLKSNLRRNIAKQVGDRDDQIADTAKILSLLISAVLDQDPAAIAALAEIKPLMSALYSPAETAVVLLERAEALRDAVAPYYEEKQRIKNDQ